MSQMGYVLIKKAKSEMSMNLSAKRLTKKADFGGEPSKQFEVAFSQLALAYIQDAAPELADRLIGFQLVDRNDDRTKAFGVFGFDLGNQVAYAPVIFVSGEIKGNELLFLPKVDLFVPLSERWVNFLLSEGSSDNLGSSVVGSPQELGIMPPNITPIVRPPIMAKRGAVDLKTKAASAVLPSVPRIGWHPTMRAFAPMYGALTAGGFDDCAFRLLKKHASLSTEKLLDDVIRLNPSMTKLAMDICDRYPAVGYYWKKFHGPDVFERALKDQVNRYRKEASILPSILNGSPLPALPAIPDIRFITSIEPGLTDKQATLLAKQGYVIEDSRPIEKLSAAGIKTPQKLANPSQTGIYQLLVKGGKFVRALIIINPKGERSGKAVAKEIGGDRWVIANPGNLYVRLPADTYEEYRKWWDGLSGTGMESGSKYVFVTENAEGSAAFSVSGKSEAGESEVYTVYSYSPSSDTPLHLRPMFDDECCFNNYKEKGLDAVRKIPGSKFRFWEGVLEIPDKAKSIRLSPDSGSLTPGKEYEIDEAVEEKTAALHLRSDGPEVSINRAKPLTKFAALKTLMIDHGFSESDAKDLLKEADVAGIIGRGFTVRVAYGEHSLPYQKQAFGGLLNGDGISSPPFPDPQTGYGPWAAGATEQMPMEHYQPVGGLGAMYNDPSTYDPSPDNIQDPMLMQQAQQAGETGQKEFFDTSMLSQLAKGIRPQNRIQEWTRDLIKSMDRLGRILLLFFWHNEEFADRYGKNDLPDLEDAIRNAFDALGEVALFLKEKDVEPLGGLQSGETSVDQAAG